MVEASEFDAVSPKPVFEPSELIDYGDASDLTRADGGSVDDGAGGYS